MLARLGRVLAAGELAIRARKKEGNMSTRTWLLATGCVVVSAATLALTHPGRALAQSAEKILRVVFTDGSGNAVGNTVNLAPGTNVGVAPASSTTIFSVAPGSGAQVPVSFPSPVNVNATLGAGSTVAVDSSQTFSPTSTFNSAPKSAVVTVNAYEGRQPFFGGIALNQGNCGNCAQGTLTLSLGGKRLVIEYVSGDIRADSTVNVQFESMILGTNTVHGAATLAPTLLGPAGGSFNDYAVNQSLRMYASDGDTLLVSVSATAGPFINISGNFITVHGYLIDP
jgi:hypothetical protein